MYCLLWTLLRPTRWKSPRNTLPSAALTWLPPVLSCSWWTQASACRPPRQQGISGWEAKRRQPAPQRWWRWQLKTKWRKSCAWWNEEPSTRRNFSSTFFLNFIFHHLCGAGCLLFASQPGMPCCLGGRHAVARVHHEQLRTGQEATTSQRRIEGYFSAMCIG